MKKVLLAIVILLGLLIGTAQVQVIRPFYIKLFDLADVAKVVPVNGWGLVYNSTNKMWTPAALPGGGDMAAATFDTDSNGFIDADNGGLNADVSGSTGLVYLTAGVFSTKGIGSDVQAYNTVLAELTALADPGDDLFVFWNDTTNNFEFSTVIAPIVGGISVGAAGSAGKLEIEDASGDVFSLQVGVQGGDTAYTLPTAFPAGTYLLASGSTGTMGWDESLSSKTVILKPMAEDTVVTAGDGVMYFTVPAELNGYNLVSVGAHVYTADDGSDDITIDIYNLTDTVDMLSVGMKIEGGEYDTATSATPGTIDGTHDDLATADVIRIDVTTYVGDNAAGLEIRLGFRKP